MGFRVQRFKCSGFKASGYWLLVSGFWQLSPIVVFLTDYRQGMLFADFRVLAPDVQLGWLGFELRSGVYRGS
jgi:hypothetical protein